MKLSKLILLVLLYLSDECRGQGDVSGGGIFGFFNQIFRRPAPPLPFVSVSTAVSYNTIVQTTTDYNLPGIVFGALSVTTKLVTVYTEPVGNIYLQ